MRRIEVASLLPQESFFYERYPFWQCFFSIATKVTEQLETAHAHIDNVWYDMVELVAAGQLNWTSQISYVVVIASLLRSKFTCYTHDVLFQMQYNIVFT